MSLIANTIGRGVDNNEQDVTFTFSVQGATATIYNVIIDEGVDWVSVSSINVRTLVLHLKKNTGKQRKTIIKVLGTDGSYCYVGLSQQDDTSLFLNSPDLRFGVGSGGGTVIVNSYLIDSIYQVETPNWLSGGPSTSSNQYVLNVTRNDTESERNGTVAIRCYWGGDNSSYQARINATQDAANIFFIEENVSFSASAQDADIMYFVGGIDSYNTQVVSKPDWVTVNSARVPIQITLAANNSELARSGVLTITNGSYRAGINIIQRGVFKLENVGCIGKDIYQSVVGEYDLYCDNEPIFKGYNVGSSIKINEIAENYLSSYTVLDANEPDLYYNPDFIHNFSIGGVEQPICNATMFPNNLEAINGLYYMSEPVFGNNMHRNGLFILSFANLEVGSYQPVRIASDGLNTNASFGSGMITILLNNISYVQMYSGNETFSRTPSLDYCFEWQIIYQNMYGGYDVYWVPNLNVNKQKQINRFYYGNWNFNNNNPWERFKTNYKNISTDTITLNMGNLTNEQNDILYRNLLTSSNIWLVDADYSMYPVNITATSFDWKQYNGRNPQRGSYTISFEIAKSIKVLS